MRAEIESSEGYAVREPIVVHVDHVEIRPLECQVFLHGRRVSLTVREFEVFWALAQRADRVVQRDELYSVVWGGVMRNRDRCVDVFVRKLRGKLRAQSPGWIYIHTHFGVGYRFGPERAAPLPGETVADPLS